MKVELCHLTFLCSNLDHGNVCPACPRVWLCDEKIYAFSVLFIYNYEAGSLILSMDALFSLKGGCWSELPGSVHGDIFFCDQNEVDEFVYYQSKIKRTRLAIILLNTLL